MKQKKLIALLLSTALLLSGVNVQTSKAADEQKQQTVAVTLHMERDADTVLAPVTVTMTEDDKNNDFGIGLATGRLQRILHFVLLQNIWQRRKRLPMIR